MAEPAAHANPFDCEAVWPLPRFPVLLRLSYRGGAVRSPVARLWVWVAEALPTRSQQWEMSPRTDTCDVFTCKMEKKHLTNNFEGLL